MISGDEVCCSVVFGTLIGVFSVDVDLQYVEISLTSTACIVICVACVYAERV